MCSAYWTLNVPDLECPYCKGKVEEQLQTHFNGEVGDCLNFYAINEAIPNLININKGTITSFISHCEDCDEYIDYCGEVEESRVVRVYPTDLDATKIREVKWATL